MKQADRKRIGDIVFDNEDDVRCLFDLATILNDYLIKRGGLDEQRAAALARVSGDVLGIARRQIKIFEELFALTRHH